MHPVGVHCNKFLKRSIENLKVKDLIPHSPENNLPTQLLYFLNIFLEIKSITEIFHAEGTVQRDGSG
jgi:hypothetical protein